MKVSMVITTFNRGSLLEQSLHRLLNLTLPDELIVIDDGGTDGTAEVVQDFAQWVPGIPVSYLYNENPGQSLCSQARNIGARRAAHDWIITTEPELFFVTDLVQQFKDLHGLHPNDVISTGQVFFQPEGLEGKPIAEVGEWGNWMRTDGWVAPHAALWGRNWLYAVGGWDEGFPGPWGWDDTDILTRLRLTGHGQYIAPEVEAIHLFHGLSGDANGANEAYFRAKSFMRDETDTTDLIANRGIEWGTLLTRTS